MEAKNSIPKVIHYCWFGRGEKPKIVLKCIESWKKKLPDYDIVEWNEENFDINDNTYVREAYGVKKYAFVSDYVRVYALYHYGGIYLDTDVEVLQTLDKFLEHPSFWGFEEGDYIATSTIGAQKGNPLIKEFLDSYRGKSFYKSDGSYNELTNVAVVTKIFQSHGVVMNGSFQSIGTMGILYPQEYFSPFDYINCSKQTTKNSYTIHYFYKSWLPPSVRLKGQIKYILSSIFGPKIMKALRR